MIDELNERGFVVIPDVLPADRIASLADAYNTALASATGDDIRVGSTSTRVTDFVNRGAAFDDLYLLPAVLEASREIIGGPFKLSSLNGRTLRQGSHGQELHVDVPRESADWPLLGFIVMIDAFRPDNGATRFVPGSHRWPWAPEDTMADTRGDHDDQVLACGSAGSLLVFNGSAWHGHTANTSLSPRRSIQGAFIPKAGRAAIDFGARMRPETRARLSPTAHDLLSL